MPNSMPPIQWSFLIPTHYSGVDCLSTARAVHGELKKLGMSDDAFEILLIPNGEDAQDSRSLAATLLSDKHALPSRVFVLPQPGQIGKGAALRAGVLAATGSRIATTDADLPYRLSQLPEATRLLNLGFDWVTVNRRTAESTFTLSLDLLPMVFGRHRLGLLFNRVVRLLFPIRSRDTQAGLKFFDGAFARAAFAHVTSPTYFYDVELFLFSHRRGFDHAELPAELLLRSEKSTIRLARDAAQALYWLARIWVQDRRGWYNSDGQNGAEAGGRMPLSTAAVLRLYRKTAASAKELVFLALRWKLTPYREMLGSIPPRARIWDLGCGHGLLELIAKSTKREILAFDHDPERIAQAQKIWQNAAFLEPFKNQVHFQIGSLPDLPSGPEATCDAALAIDVLHYFSFEEQTRIVRGIWESLTPGGQFIVREVEPQGKGLTSRFNRAYEKWSTRRGLTRSKRKTQLFFRTEDQWIRFFSTFGFSVQSRACSHPLFADILYICRKPDLSV